MFKKISAILLVAVLIFSVASVGVVAATFVPSQAVADGIDVSEHQGSINWDSVKASGKVDFVIIRCGYGQDRTSQDDDCFLTNVQECQRVGIPFGLYLYSYTTTTSGALGEADHAIRLINQCKSYSMFQLPIYYDLEESSAYALSNSAVLEYAKAFHDKVESSTGKTVGIYANTNWFNNKLTDSWYQDQPLWCAQYNSSCTYAGDYDLWQYSDSGSVSGISGGVDMNYSRVPVSQIAGVTTPALSTDKTVYQRTDGNVEPVMVSATCSASDSWVGIFPASANVATDGSIAWFYCNDGGANPRDIWYSNYDTSVAWPVAAGDYKVVLFGDGGKTNVLKTVKISVASASLTTDASTYCVNNDIYVSTDYYASDAWVGLYENGVTPSNSNTSLYWYYLSAGGTSNTNIFGFNRVRPNDYKAGKYDIILFADDGYEILAKKTVTVKNCTDSSTDKDHKCDYCGTDGITSHTYDQKNTASKYQKSAATCTKKAVYYYSCRCGDKGTSTFSSGSALGHSYKSSVTTKATCNTDGVRTYTCSTCKDKYTEAIPATGNHSYTGTITKQPTCTENGVKTFTCSTCSDKYTETIPASGEHTYDDGVVTTQPTCTTDGVKTFTCGACGDSYTEAVPASGAHTAAAAAYENNAETGCYDAVVKCSACGEDITRLATDIPNGTKVNNSITVTPYVFITDSVGVMTRLKKSQLSSYSTFAVRFARQAFNNSYNYYMEYDELNQFEGTSSPYCVNANVALFEMALPMTYSVCGYDANGNLVAVSKPAITTITDLLWANYNADTEKNKPMYLDLINMGSYAQDYFASQQKNPCDLSNALRPADVYAFDQNYASPNVPEYDTTTLPNSTVNGKVIKDVQNRTCTINNKMLNLAGAAPTLQYMIRYGAKVADPNLWSVTYSYDSASKKTITGTLSGMGDANTNLHTSSSSAYALIAPALYDSDKTVTAVFKYNGEVVFTDSYSVDTWIAATLPTLTTDNETSRLVNTIAKFGVSVRNYFLKV